MRGIGQTSLMIANLTAHAVVVAPNKDIATALEREIALRRPLIARNIKVVVVNDNDDIQKLAGLSAPIFFDNSFLELKSAEVIRAAYESAIIASRSYDWMRHPSI